MGFRECRSRAAHGEGGRPLICACQRPEIALGPLQCAARLNNPPPADCQHPAILKSGSSWPGGRPIFSWSPNGLARVLQAFCGPTQNSQKSRWDPIERQGALLYKHLSRFTAEFSVVQRWSELVLDGSVGPLEHGLCLPGSEANESCPLRGEELALAGECRWLCSFFDNLVVVRVASEVSQMVTGDSPSPASS